MSEELRSKAEPKPSPAGDTTTQVGGQKIYDKGESVVTKMNREKAVFDRDLFIQDLYENWLVCVQREEPRRHPKSGLYTKWTVSTTFDDFMSDSIDNLDQKLESIKFAKIEKPKKFKAIDDSALAEMKIDSGSDQVGKQFGVEDYDALEEIIRRSKEVLLDIKRGVTQVIIDTKTGRIRVAKANQ